MRACVFVCDSYPSSNLCQDQSTYSLDSCSTFSERSLISFATDSSDSADEDAPEQSRGRGVGVGGQENVPVLAKSVKSKPQSKQMVWGGESRTTQTTSKTKKQTNQTTKQPNNQTNKTNITTNERTNKQTKQTNKTKQT